MIQKQTGKPCQNQRRKGKNMLNKFIEAVICFFFDMSNSLMNSDEVLAVCFTQWSNLFPVFHIPCPVALSCHGIIKYHIGMTFSKRMIKKDKEPKC